MAKRRRSWPASYPERRPPSPPTPKLNPARPQAAVGRACTAGRNYSGLGCSSTPLLWARGELPQHEPQVAHRSARRGESTEGVQLGDHRHGRQCVGTGSDYLDPIPRHFWDERGRDDLTDYATALGRTLQLVAGGARLVRPGPRRARPAAASPGVSQRRRCAEFATVWPSPRAPAAPSPACGRSTCLEVGQRPQRTLHTV